MLRRFLPVLCVLLLTGGLTAPSAAPGEPARVDLEHAEPLAGHAVRGAAHVVATEALGPNATHAFLGAPGASWPCPTTDLEAAFACLRGRMPGVGSLGYHRPSAAEAENWTALAASLLASTDCTASIPTLLVGVVSFVRLDAGGPDADVCVLAETGDADGDGVSDRGWGGLALRLGAAHEVYLQAPHVQYDVGTGEQAVGVFRLVDGVRSVAWAGAHRYANTPTSGPDGSDMSEALGSVFMASLEAMLGEADADAAFLSIHGMLDAFCDSDVFLTTGQARVASAGEPVLNLRDALRAEYAGTDAAINAYGDDPDCLLTGGNNVQGMRVRDVGRTFLHMESEDKFINRTRAATAVAAADLNSLGTRNPAWPCTTWNLSATYACLKGTMGQAGSLAYRAPSAAERTNWTALAEDVLSTGTCVRSLVPPLLHGIVEVTRLDAPHGDVCVVAEVLDADLDGASDRGWGGYAVHLTGARDVHVMAPYPFYHTDTGEHATGTFAALPGARSVAWAGAHRFASPDPATPGAFASDAAVRTDTMLMATLDAMLEDSTTDGVFLNLHAFADGACPGSPIYLTPADGTTPPTNGPTAALRDELAAEFNVTATMTGDAGGCGSTGEMRVAQSAPVSDAGRTFILALTEHAYQDGAGWARAVDAANLGE